MRINIYRLKRFLKSKGQIVCSIHRFKNCTYAWIKDNDTVKGIRIRFSLKLKPKVRHRMPQMYMAVRLPKK